MSLKYSNLKMKEAFQMIEDNSDYVFFYNAQQIKLDEKVSLNIENKDIEDILDELFSDKPISYKVIDRRIVLYPKSNDDVPAKQQKSHPVKGKVTSDAGEPIPGTTVRIKGTMVGTVTDMDGNYNLTDVNEKSILVFSFVGMRTVEIPVNGRLSIDVKMQVDAVGLEEVVAIGYGSQKKRDLTGSVASINAEDLQSVSVPIVGDALQGRAAGVQVIANGTPGSDPTFRIRGMGTVNNNDPLLVIDGVPTESGLNQLSMDDVENIQVLKDASATAIYGSRGANGVVIITTKKGTTGKGQINFSAYYGVQETTGLIDMLDGSQ
ncbi:MAG: TonB-dependent receptor plug domain-containing protein, partial [Draconibacterium sp.]